MAKSFWGNAIDRQGNLLALIREIRKGNLIILAPDLDLGLRDSVFVPFFGIPTNTITAVSRLALIAQAEVCMMVTTLLPDRSRYCCAISKPIDGFPSGRCYCRCGTPKRNLRSRDPPACCGVLLGT
jgi:Kdo2-lipid IVA lauroyltransferase/acyltransferase